ncbi:unnamed protein product [Caretta caretta]
MGKHKVANGVGIEESECKAGKLKLFHILPVPSQNLCCTNDHFVELSALGRTHRIEKHPGLPAFSSLQDQMNITHIFEAFAFHELPAWTRTPLC